MTRTPKPGSRRRVDLASLALLLIGLVFGAMALQLVLAGAISGFALTPSIIAIMVGASHLTKIEAPHAPSE